MAAVLQQVDQLLDAGKRPAGRRRAGDTQIGDDD
jgi:hypothetical protein